MGRTQSSHSHSTSPATATFSASSKHSAGQPLAGGCCCTWCGKFGLENQRKRCGDTGSSSLPRSAACSAGTGHTLDFGGSERCRGSQRCRNFPDWFQSPANGAPCPMSFISFTFQTKRLFLLLERGREGKDYNFFSLFPIWQSNANRWSCAGQRPLALAEHGGSSSRAWNSNY